MGSHPVPAHEEGGGHVIPGEDIINASIEPGGQFRFLAQIKGQRDQGFFAVAVIDKVNVGIGQGRCNISPWCFCECRGRCNG